MDRTHGGHVDPISLNGASAGEATLVGGGEMTIQAALYSHTTHHLHWRLARAAATGDTTLATSEGFVTHGGSAIIKLPVGANVYLCWLLTDITGAAVAAGASDYLLRSVDRR
jgi:hypothetical protein